jgi:hypothetical protein
MSRSVAVVAVAALAATAMWAPAAQAKGGGGGHPGGGAGMKFSSGPSQHHNNHIRFRRDTIVASTHNAEEKRIKRVKLATPPADKAVLIKHADGKGRAFDLASKTWCDGNHHCWSGKHAWTFKDGAWFYGTARWYEADGNWRTDTAEAPIVVDCETVPAFAAVKPTTGQALARKEIDDTIGSEPGNAPQTPIKTVEKAAADTSPAECKKYFPSVGEMLPVPCEG